MSSPAYDVAQWLVTQGFTFGGLQDWAISVAAEADAPDNTISIYDLSGGTPMTDQLTLLNVRIQVRVKGQDYNAAYTKAAAIRDLLMLAKQPVMNGAQYIGFNLESDIWSLGRNASNQYLIVANYAAIKQRN